MDDELLKCPRNLDRALYLIPCIFAIAATLISYFTVAFEFVIILATVFIAMNLFHLNRYRFEIGDGEIYTRGVKTVILSFREHNRTEAITHVKEIRIVTFALWYVIPRIECKFVDDSWISIRLPSLSLLVPGYQNKLVGEINSHGGNAVKSLF